MAGSDSLEELVALLNFEKKGDLAKHARGLTIHSEDFVQLIWACESSDVGYRHLIHHRDIVPEHLRVRVEDLTELASGSEVGRPPEGRPQKIGSRIVQLFRQRRLLVGHLFFTPDMQRWHFFYFDQRDYGRENNHWEHGSHIHFLNFLWPEYSAQGLWEAFTSGNPKVRGGLHIRYEDHRGAST